MRKLTQEWYAGYASSDPANEAELELLDVAGKLQRFTWGEIKWLCYVRELPSATSGHESSLESARSPERLLRRRFSSRPRTVGLWLKITFTDGDEIEGLGANDRSLVGGAGLLLTPPDTRSSTQRIFVPNGAIQDLTVLAVIGASTPGRPQPLAQPDLFDNDRPS